MPLGGSASLRHAVLDTNILVSALLHPDGPPGHVLAAVQAGDLVPVFSPAMLAEYESVLRRPRLRLDAAKVAAALHQFHAIGTLVRTTAPPPAGLPDGSDWPFIAGALAAGCPVVTGNARHYPPRLGVRVMTAREWIDQQRP